MEEKRLYDITVVCRMLNTTSRTLRFYEEKGIVTSTTVGLSARRQYTEEQISHIRNVLVLRTLGLSVKSILELQAQKVDLKDAIISKRAEIIASIDLRVKEINLLNEALSALELGKSIFVDTKKCFEENQENIELAKICTNAILSGDEKLLYEHLSMRMAQYMPKEVYKAVLKDTVTPLGLFVSSDGIIADDKYSNKVYSLVRYSKLGLKITFVFYNGLIDGLWFSYYDVKEKYNNEKVVIEEN